MFPTHISKWFKDKKNGESRRVWLFSEGQTAEKVKSSKQPILWEGNVKRREVSVHQDDLFKQDEQTLLDTMDGRVCWLWALGH